MTHDRTLIYLADLTHLGPVLSSNVQPLAVGLIGAQLLKTFPGEIEVELFKYPRDLSAALARRAPRILGFSNYSWNAHLSYQYARVVKERFPETIVVFGGPNYDLTEPEMEAFWRRYPRIDFCVVKEGELAAVELFRSLRRYDFDVSRLKEDGCLPPNCHYVWNGQLRQGEMLPRLKDLNAVPSPYLMGLMDKFFDDVLSPMTYTTRGCPFSCTFCSEGAVYYNKVAQRTDLEEELEYIARRRGKVPDLYLADANFGMYQQDVAKTEVIARIQRKYGWPKRLVVATGKNHKERVIHVSKLLDGALNVAASLQSTDAGILQNIKRANLSLDALTEMARNTAEADSDTYTEIILGLPGDTRQRHFRTLRDVVEADLGIVRMFQLIMLPQTELNNAQTREEFGLQTRWRIMPRSFGRYEVLGQTVTAVESEEICVGGKELSFDDYVECRELNLTVEILHNGRMFAELRGLCRWLGVSWFDFLLRCHNKRREFNSELTALYDEFRQETIGRLWRTQDELVRYVQENLDALTANEGSTNEMANAKSRAAFRLQAALHDWLFGEMETLLAELARNDPDLLRYVRDLKTFSYFQKAALIDRGQRFRALLHFDFEALQNQGYAVDPRSCQFDSPVEFTFEYTAAQAEYIEGYVRQYGVTLDGLGRILMRAWPTSRLFRRFSIAGLIPADTRA